MQVSMQRAAAGLADALAHGRSGIRGLLSAWAPLHHGTIDADSGDTNHCSTSYAQPNRRYSSKSAESPSAADAAATAQAPPAASGTPEEHARHLAGLLQRAAASTLRLTQAAAEAALYRDLSVSLNSLHQKDTLGIANPLIQNSSNAGHSQPGAGTAGGRGSSGSKGRRRFPMFDVTKLPDVPDDGPELQEKYMDKISAWQQLLPPHVEVSYQTGTGIMLFPPREATYPSFVDLDAALRGLQPHVRKVKTKRFKFSKRRAPVTFVQTAGRFRRKAGRQASLTA